MTTIRATVTIVAATIIGGCGDGRLDRATALNRDSAGVEIVELLSTNLSQTHPLSSTPLLTIGTPEGSPEYTLDEIHAVTLGPGGTILISERASIRMYDSLGHYVHTLARSGEGPGEFQWIARVLYCAPFIYILDMMKRSLTALTANGMLTSSPAVHLVRTSSGHQLEGCTRQGLVVSVPGGSHDGARSTTSRRSRLIHLVRDSVFSDPIVAILGPETYGRLPVPFGREDVFAITDSLILYIDTWLPEVRVLALDGALKKIIRLPLEAESITEDDVARALDSYRRGAGIEAPLLVGLEAQLPDRRPLFAEIRAGTDGAFWVRMYDGFRARQSAQGQQWLRITDSVLVRSYTLPSRFQPHVFEGDRVLGVWRDSLGVSFVRSYSVD